MTGRAANTLWELLRGEGLVDDAPCPQTEVITVPWYVRAMTGITGWIAAALLVAVVPVGLGGMFDDGWMWLAIGGAACLLAWYLSIWGGSGDFTDQFSFALSVAGQVQMLIGIEQLVGWDLRTLGWVVVGLETLLYFAIAGFVHRVWTVVAGGLALLYLVDGLEQNNILLALTLVAFALVWLNEFNNSRHSRYLYPLGYGLLSVVTILVITGSTDMGGLRSEFVPQQGLSGGVPMQPLLGALAVAAVVVAVTLAILRQQVISHRRGAGLALLCVAVMVVIATLWAPGIGAAYLVILIGYAHGNRVLLGVGGFVLLSYLGHYYYALELSLLHKSAVLVTTGLGLLMARLLFHRLRWIGTEDPAGAADA